MGGLQFLIVYIGLFALLTRSNPFTYLNHIIPAQLFAFASASSAATIPTSLNAVKSSGVVPDLIGRFVIPLGATVNMDGGAVYFVCACIWLAVLNGEEVTVASFFIAHHYCYNWKHRHCSCPFCKFGSYHYCVQHRLRRHWDTKRICIHHCHRLVYGSPSHRYERYRRLHCNRYCCPSVPCRRFSYRRRNQRQV